MKILHFCILLSLLSCTGADDIKDGYTTDGYILYINGAFVNDPRKSHRVIDYVYFVDSEMYFNSEVIQRQGRKHYPGNKLKVKVSRKNPANSKIISFYQKYTNSQSNYYSHYDSDSNIIYSINLINNLIFYKVSKKDKVLEDQVGYYTFRNDSIFISDLNSKSVYLDTLVPHNEGYVSTITGMSFD